MDSGLDQLTVVFVFSASTTRRHSCTSNTKINMLTGFDSIERTNAEQNIVTVIWSARMNECSHIANSFAANIHNHSAQQEHSQHHTGNPRIRALTNNTNCGRSFLEKIECAQFRANLRTPLRVNRELARHGPASSYPRHIPGTCLNARASERPTWSATTKAVGRMRAALTTECVCNIRTIP